jgi:hypothetical protein
MAKAIRGKIESWLSELGVAIGVVDELDGGVAGVFDPKAQRRNAKGFIEMIRVARGEKGDMEVPEEFAHLIHAALKDKPLMQRLTALLSGNDALVESILEADRVGSYNEYLAAYKGKNQKERMVKEATGKLLKHQILMQESAARGMEYTSLLKRIEGQFKQIFSKGDPLKYEKELNDLDRELGQLYSDLISGQMKMKITLDMIKTEDTLYSLATSLERAKAIHNKAIVNQRKLTRIEEARGQTVDPEREKLIAQSGRYFTAGRHNEAIADVMDNAIADFQQLLKDFKNLNINNNMSNIQLNQAAKALNKIKLYLDCYEDLSKSIYSYYHGNQNIPQAYIKTSYTLNGLISQLRFNYEYNITPIFTEFLRQFWPEGGIDGKTLENVLAEADSDINFMQRWLNSAAETTDYSIKLVDQAIKKQRDWQTGKSLEAKRRLQVAHLELEKGGGKVASLYERINGKLTGNLISNIDYDAYNKALEAAKTRLRAQYADDAVYGSELDR